MNKSKFNSSKKSTVAIQGTNDSSIVSKLSMVTKGYFQDDFLKAFVSRFQRRSSLINRGYYIRSKAVNSAFSSFFASLLGSPYKESQVISLGAGFDSSYFRMKSEQVLPSRCRYIEVDFPDVMKRKLACIKTHPDLLKLIPSDCIDGFSESHPQIILYSSDYILMGIDLRDIDCLQTVFEVSGVKYDLPTMLLSECVITYMDVDSSSKLISWAQKKFSNSAFVTYEQVYPYDGFGHVMQNHFSAIGSPLRSVQTYPDVIAQKMRYMSLGWTICGVIGMNKFFSTLVNEEKQRIQRLEMFDEYEGWHQKCSHYVLIWACQGLMLSMHNLLNDKDDESEIIYDSLQTKEVQFKKQIASPLLQRYGHQTIYLPHGFLLSSGGFGQLHRKHQRLKGAVITDLETGNTVEVVIHDFEENLGSRMHHSTSLLCNGQIVVYGGRCSPAKPYSGVLLLEPLHTNKDETLSVPLRLGANSGSELSPHHCHSQQITSKSENDCSLFETIDRVKQISLASNNFLQYTSQLVKEKGIVPCSRWRHSSSYIQKNGMEYLVVFGGCTRERKATNDCYILNTATWTWSEVHYQIETPSSRHSHSSVAYNSNCVIITGGLSEDEHPLNSVNVLDVCTQTWTLLNIAGLLPRYSHTSHIYKNQLILIGGTNHIPQAVPGVAVIDLETLQVKEFALPEQDPEYPILLHSHSSVVHNDKIITLGGGGNCFSFGTHLNKHMLQIDINQFLL